MYTSLGIVFFSLYPPDSLSVVCLRATNQTPSREKKEKEKKKKIISRIISKTLLSQLVAQDPNPAESYS
jgi:hypothetical protein